MKRVIFIVAIIFVMLTASDIVSASTCYVTKTGGDDCTGCLINAVWSMNGGECDTVQISASGTITLVTSFSISGDSKIIGNNSVTLKAGPGVSMGYLIKVKGKRTLTTTPTLQNIIVEAAGKTAIQIDSTATGHYLKNVTVKNSEVGINVASANTNKFEGITASGNNYGIRVITGDYNLITKGSFFDNMEAAIRLQTGGNMDLEEPTKIVSIVPKDSDKVAGITGLVQTSVTSMELFELDPGVSTAEQGQGKFYLNALAPVKKSWDVDGRRRFANTVSNIIVGQKYTLTAKDAKNNTSEFSLPIFVYVTAGIKCLSAEWFLKSMDGIKKGETITSDTANPWDFDYDKDGCSNDDEDPSLECDSAKWKSDPNDPNDNACNPTPPTGEDCGDKLGKVACDSNKYGSYICNDWADKSAEACACTLEHASWAKDLKNLIADNCFDYDGDGIINDNCPYVPNANQSDIDGDGIGDLCDNDRDGDGIVNNQDNCKDIPNKDQADKDDDGIGDVCDPVDDTIDDGGGTTPGDPDDDIDDADKDGIEDDIDNCPGVTNADILACADKGPDEGAAPGSPVCWNFGQLDSDKDGFGDICDNCPIKANKDQANLDKDEFGDICDDDIDGDGILNIDDNCVYHHNPKQEDSDVDGVGDRCDIDEGASPAGSTPAPIPYNNASIQGGGSAFSNAGGCDSNISGAAVGVAGFSLRHLLSFAMLFVPAVGVMVRRRKF